MTADAESELLELELLRAAREQLAPTPAQRGALRGAVLASVGLLGTLGAASVPPPRPSGVRPRPVPRVVEAPEGTLDAAAPMAALAAGSSSGRLAAVTALGRQFGLRTLVGGTMGGVLVGLAAGYFAFGPSSQTGVEGGERARTVEDAPRVIDEHVPTLLDGREAPPHTHSVGLDDLGAEAETPVLARKPTVEKSSAQAAATEEAPGPPMSFYEELTYLRRAQAALRRGESALALGLMQSLDRLKVGGALLSERGMTKVLALCLLERTEEAVRVGRELAASSDASLYRERLAKSCAHSALTGEGDSVEQSSGVREESAGATTDDVSSEDRERQPGH